LLSLHINIDQNEYHHFTWDKYIIDKKQLQENHHHFRKHLEKN